MENSTNSSAQNTAGNQTSNQENNGLAGGLSGMLGNLNGLPDMLKQYGDTAAKKVSGLSTTQKVIGGALLLLGAKYLSGRSKKDFSNRKNS